MTVLSDYIARMIELGMDQEEAVQIVTDIFAAGAANVVARSANALRQQRYRDRKKTVTNRNESVTRNAQSEATETVTKRNDVTVRYASSLSLKRVDDNNKKEERKRERRATQLPDGWRPPEERWTAACRALGEDGASRELRKFTNYALEKGRTAKNWNAAWDNWVDRAVEWGARIQPSPGAVSQSTPRATTVHQQRQQESRDVLNAMRQFNSGTGSGADSGVLRLDTGDEPTSLRGGSGGNLIELSAGGRRSCG